jgi:transcriptional regulator with XRE-family HTH domain
VTEYARIRRFLGLTQRDLSLATGVSINRISALERGISRLTKPEREVLMNFLSRRLHVTLESDQPSPTSGRPTHHGSYANDDGAASSLEGGRES